VKALLDTFRNEFKSSSCDLEKCSQLLGQLKLKIFSTTGGLIPPGGDERALAREILELACLLSIRRRDPPVFERHVAQLKLYYTDHGADAPSEQKYPILGLYLLHLLASDRIGEFHTELELIPVDEHENKYIKQPIELERCLMEGNYAKILQAQKDVPDTYYPFFMERLMDTVRQKVGASLERSYEHLPAADAANMLILGGVPALQEFAMKENDRKAREEEEDDQMGELTPSLSRRGPTGRVRWEVRDGKLHFIRSAQKRLEIPALDLMGYTIGYATDLERIV